MSEERWFVRLLNRGGNVVSTADFASEVEAAKYREQAEVTAKEIGGRVETTEPEGETQR